MAKAEWGTKRTCQSCDARFYDMQRQPIVCPKCGAEFKIEVAKPRRPAAAPKPAAAVKPVPKKEAEDLDDDVDLDDDDDDDLLAPDDDDDDDDVPVVRKGGDDSEET